MDLAEFLEEHNIEIAPENHHHTTPNFIQVDCPYCSPDSRRFRLGLRRDGRSASCWSCGWKDIKQTLAILAGIRSSQVELDSVVSKREEKPRGKLQLPKGICDLLPCHRRYLEGRGFDPDELVKLWGIRGIGLAAKLAWRIWIPFRHEGQIVSWTTRSLADSGTRYISAKPEQEIVSHKKILIGEEYVRHSCIVVEGPFDMFRIGPGACCTAGISYSQEQLSRMGKFPVRMVCFDRELEAQKRAREICRHLSVFPGETINVVLKAKDPGSASKQEIKELRRRFLE